MMISQKTQESRFGAQKTGQLWCARVSILIACIIAASAASQTVRDTHGTAAVVPLQNEPPAKIFVDPPLARFLSLGAAVVRYRTNNLRIAPVFGAAALSISPRVGHIHVGVDEAHWVWAHTSAEPVTVVGLPLGPHEMRFQLMNANHQRLGEDSVKFTVPAAQTAGSAATHDVRKAYGGDVQPSPIQMPAKIIIDSPLPEPLSRGVVFIRYRTEILDVVPGTQPAALAVSPHIRVTVDESPWYWVDASGNPIIIQGLAPGRHKILVDLVNADDRVLDQQTIEITMPEPPSKPEAE